MQKRPSLLIWGGASGRKKRSLATGEEDDRNDDIGFYRQILSSVRLNSQVAVLERSRARPA